MRQQWTTYRGHGHTDTRLTTDMNAQEHEAIALDRVTGFYRNPIDLPLNAYEQKLANDAMLSIALTCIKKHGPFVDWEGNPIQLRRPSKYND